MNLSVENFSSTSCIVNSNSRLTDNVKKKTMKEKIKVVLKQIKYIYKETTVEPCLFIYMLCISLSSLAVQNMHLEKSCRVNFNFSDEICDKIRDRDTKDLTEEVALIQSLVAKVVAWKLPIQNAIPAVLVLFIGAWSDKNKKRKICILFPMIGEIIANTGLILATYYFYELSLVATVLIETLPAAFTGSYIIIFMGMYSFMADRTSVENRTFRLGLVTICVSLGTPTGTALSGILLRWLGYYGIFSLLLLLHSISFIYGLLKLEDVHPIGDVNDDRVVKDDGRLKKRLREVLGLVVNTLMVAVKPRANGGRVLIFLLLILYILMVGPLYGDSQVAYLYAIRKFNLTGLEWSVYGTVSTVLGLIGTVFCISFLSKKIHVEDSAIGALAGASRIAACFVFAFAPSRPWYYFAPLVNMFSHAGLTAVRSIATKSVPTEEVAKLSSLMGVMEAIAPSVYMPASCQIYEKTIRNFPGAFYMLDAVVTVIAMAIFGFIYKSVKRRSEENRIREKATIANQIVVKF